MEFEGGGIMPSESSSSHHHEHQQYPSYHTKNNTHTTATSGPLSNRPSIDTDDGQQHGGKGVMPLNYYNYKGSYARPGPARDSNLSVATAPPQAPRGEWDDLFKDSKKREQERKSPAGLLKQKQGCEVEGAVEDGKGEGDEGVHSLRRKRTGSNVTV